MSAKKNALLKAHLKYVFILSQHELAIYGYLHSLGKMMEAILGIERQDRFQLVMQDEIDHEELVRSLSSLLHILSKIQETSMQKVKVCVSKLTVSNELAERIMMNDSIYSDRLNACIDKMVQLLGKTPYTMGTYRDEIEICLYKIGTYYETKRSLFFGPEKKEERVEDKVVQEDAKQRHQQGGDMGAKIPPPWLAKEVRIKHNTDHNI